MKALLESQSFVKAVESIVLPHLSARKSKLILEQVHYVLHEACAMQQEWEALNKVLTELKTAGAHAQDEGRSVLEQIVKQCESKLHSLVEKVCEEYLQLKNLQVLSEQLQSLLESNLHAAPTDAMAGVVKWTKRAISNMLPMRKKKTDKIINDEQRQIVPETMPQEGENEPEDKNTLPRLLELIRKFCTVTLDEKSVGALKALWVEIKQEFDKLKFNQESVGMHFRMENADIPVSADQVSRFVRSSTFANAVEHIALVKLVEARIRQPTQRQSTQLAQASRSAGRLHRLHTFKNVLITEHVAMDSESYTAIQNVVTKEEGAMNRPLGQLYADRQVLPGLLEELESLLQKQA